MVVYLLYWIWRCKVYFNVFEHIESLKDENLQYEIFYLYEQYRQLYSEENFLENDFICNMDILIFNQFDFDINISDV